MFTLICGLCLCGGFEPWSGPGVGDLAELLGCDAPDDLVFPDAHAVHPIFNDRNMIILFSLAVLLTSVTVYSTLEFSMSEDIELHPSPYLLIGVVLSLCVSILSFYFVRQL
ncbi:hypothetical protein [Candidatus Ichthyocystis sparus]|uniref:hypothetical protein n=1 Tax=Candidatus Ichthyocystis sparus TaxID=1561004 RepID=UPI000B875ADA|nr:hypothetical protein [Candidatus Ichthyocystis sparus]